MNNSIFVKPNREYPLATVEYMGVSYAAVIGKNGVTANKQEGDGKTPLGTFPLREVWYRADRIKNLKTNLPIRVITEKDAWSDDSKSPDYNRHIFADRSHPESLMRDDHLYDLAVIIGYNDDPPVPGKGSAIFMHLARDQENPANTPTAGCIALKKDDLLQILENSNLDTKIKILNN